MQALREFLEWWGRHLLAWLPARLRRRGQAHRNVLVAETHLHADPPAATLTLRRRGRQAQVGRFTLDEAGARAMRSVLAERVRPRPTSVVLRVPPDLLLERRVPLPLAAERDLDRVLTYEMDRLTPFTADELFWTWRIERRDRAEGRLLVQVSLVPKATVAAAVDALEKAGAAPSLLEADVAEEEDGEEPRLLPLRHVAPPSRRWQRPALALAGGACAVLAVAAVAIPFVEQSLAQDEAEATIASLRPQVDQVSAIRRRIADTRAGGDELAAQRARVGDALEMLAVLTQALPDDTYLTDLALRGRAATMSGQSAAAARIIGALSADAAVRNPAFTAPVTRNELGQKEGFSIRTEFGP
jgi:general secretion pathway protein L